MEGLKEKQVCLWCKSEHLIVIHGEDENDDKYYAVGCQDCGADGPHVKRSKGKKAAWEAYKSGASVSHAELQRVIDKVQKILEHPTKLENLTMGMGHIDRAKYMLGGFLYEVKKLLPEQLLKPKGEGKG